MVTSPSPLITFSEQSRWFVKEYPRGLLIEEGIVNIMLAETSAKVEDPLFPPITFVMQLTKGYIIFSTPKTDHPQVELLAIAESGVKCRQLSESEIMEHFRSSDDGQMQVVRSMRKWLFGLASFLQPLRNEVYEATVDWGDNTIAAGTIISPINTAETEKHQIVTWIEVKKGTLTLFGIPGLKIKNGGGIFPLCEPMWVAAEEDCQVHVWHGRDLIAEPNFFYHLDHFHMVYLAIGDVLLKQRVKNKQENINTEIKDEAELLDASLRQMSLVFDPASTGKPLPIGAGPLFKACQIVGHSIGISFKQPRRQFSTFTEESISQLCQNSSVYYRRVILDKNWFKEAAFPMLCFKKATESPVAILYDDKKGGYFLVDPSKPGREKVTEALAETLQPDGYIFYEELPHHALSSKDILQFCLSKQGWNIFLLLAFGCLGALISLIPSFLNRILIDRVLIGGERNLLGQVILGLVVVALTSSLFLFARAYTALRFTRIIDMRLRTATWARVLQLPVRFIRTFTTGEFIQRVYAISTIHQTLSNNAIRVVLSGLFSVFYLFAMLYFSPRLTLIGMIVIVITIALLAICVSRKIKWQRLYAEESQTLQGYVLQLIEGIEKLRATGAENRAFALWSQRYAHLQSVTYRSWRISSFETLTSSVFPILASLLLFITAVDIIQNPSSGADVLTLGSLIAFLAAFTPFSSAIFSMANTMMQLAPIVPLWERARVIVQAPTEESEAKAHPGQLSGAVTVDNVSFRYDVEGAWVLNGLSLHANPGESIAIVGWSGSGKTTLIRLLLGFEHPEKGAVFYDGKNLSSLSLKDVRKQIGTVLQDGALVAGSVYENIVCGGNYSTAEIQQALKLSGFDKDIDNLPMGLHTVVQTGSTAFCGGQLQRLLIARALIAQPHILILDEATASLDNMAQKAVMENLASLRVTRIIVAHRISTVRQADRIYVMEKGKIIQSGTFEELSVQEGLFKEMLGKQSVAST